MPSTATLMLRNPSVSSMRRLRNGNGAVLRGLVVSPVRAGCAPIVVTAADANVDMSAADATVLVDAAGAAVTAERCD